MFNNLEGTQIQQTDDADLLAAIGGESDGDDKSKKKPTEKKVDEKEKPSDDKKTKVKQPSSKSSTKDNFDTKKNVTDLSEDDLDIAAGGDDDDDDDEDTDDDDKKKTKKKADKKSSKKEEDDDNQDDDTDDDEKTDDDDDEKTDEDDEEKTDDEEEAGDLTVSNFLKARVDLLVKSGAWVDFDGRDEVEWDEDSFEEMENQQREYQRQVMTNEILESFGPIGREIAEFTANGGNPDELIDIFKEQQKVEALSIETEDQQKAVVLKYATEFQKMKPERAKKYVDSLIADKELEATAKDAKDSMEENLKEQAEQLQKDQKEAVKQQQLQVQQNLQKFANDVAGVLKTRSDIPAEEKQELLKVLTKFDKKLKNGTPVNEFYYKLAEFRKDLPNYIDLVRFVLNPKKFVKTAVNRGKTETAEKAFRLIRTDNKKKKVKPVEDAGSDDTGTKKSGGFKLL